MFPCMSIGGNAVVDSVKDGCQESDVDNCGYWFHSLRVNIEMTIKGVCVCVCLGGEVMSSSLDVLI